jgi:hypothetical protein
MAKITKTSYIPPGEEVITYTLELSEDEAKGLTKLLYSGLVCKTVEDLCLGDVLMRLLSEKLEDTSGERVFANDVPLRYIGRR